jgi:hypothetical protein
VTWPAPQFAATILFANKAEQKRSLLHELGHDYDRQVIEPRGLRASFAAIFGWRWTTPRSEEWFAQTYALCACNRKLSRMFASGYHGFKITPRQFLAACRLIRSAA